jgi:uncharacterized protein (TIGR03083 family)
MAETFAMIAVQRRSVADLLAGFSDEEWATPSLCAGWRVREVAAHLTMPFNVGKAAFVVSLIRAGGNFGKVTDSYAKQAAAAQPPSAFVATLRANADSHFTPPGLGPGAPLSDTVIHGLDIGVPVGRKPALPAEAAKAVLDFLAHKAVKPFVPKGLLTGLRFESTDLAWTAGSGPTVAGPAESLILVMTGRRAGLDGLSGEGLAELRRRLGA